MDVGILIAIVGAGSSLGTVLVNKFLSKKQDHLSLLAGMQDKWYKEIGRLEEKIRVLEANEEKAQILESKLTSRIEELEKENSRLTFKLEVLQRQLDERDNL